MAPPRLAALTIRRHEKLHRTIARQRRHPLQTSRIAVHVAALGGLYQCYDHPLRVGVHQALREGGDAIACSCRAALRIARLTPRERLSGATPSLFFACINSHCSPLSRRQSAARSLVAGPDATGAAPSEPGSVASLHHAAPPQREHRTLTGGGFVTSGQAGGRSGVTTLGPHQAKRWCHSCSIPFRCHQPGQCVRPEVGHRRLRVDDPIDRVGEHRLGHALHLFVQGEGRTRSR